MAASVTSAGAARDATRKAEVIHKRVVRQILEALRKYFPTTGLNRVYWPRCLRDFISEVATNLEPVMEREGFLFDVSECAEIMKKPTSHYIDVGYRHEVRKLLNFALSHYESEHSPPTTAKPLEKEKTPSGEWPSDLVDVEDLRESIGLTSLRGDVIDFFFHTQEKLSFQLRIKYNHAGEVPITLETQSEEAASAVRAFLGDFGQRAGKHHNLLPMDVINISVRLNLLSVIDAKEESFLPSGTPLKRGTLGTVLKAESSVSHLETKTVGISCAHVVT